MLAQAAWRRIGKVACDLALSLALGGDCLADLALLRAEPGVYGAVASEATVSRTLAALASDADVALWAINAERAAAWERAWALAGEAAPGHGASAAAPVVIDLDATIVLSHSEKEQAAGTHKRTFGFHPLLWWDATRTAHAPVPAPRYRVGLGGDTSRWTRAGDAVRRPAQG